MAVNNRWVVRVVLTPGEASKLGDFVTTLAQLGLTVMHRRDATGVCFDLLPPEGTFDSHSWANRAAETLEEFEQLNAVAAPRWVSGDDRPAGRS